MVDCAGIREGMLAFYARFSAGDAEAFAAGIADTPGTSVIGSAPGEGHDNRADWVATYAEMCKPGGPMAGIKLVGENPRGWAEGSVGFGVDNAAFVLPDGSRLPARLTAVLREEDGIWKVVHLHFSVGVPDEDAVQPAA
jgi:hypothetical protein